MDQQTIAGHYGRRNLFAHIFLLRWMKKSTIVEGIALLYVVLFLYTGVSKLLQYPVFRIQLWESPVLRPFSGAIAWLLPVTEFIISVFLFVPRWRLKGLYAATILMIAFTIYIIVILNIDRQLPCSCGGIISALSWEGHLVFNTGFIVLGLLAIFLAKQMVSHRENGRPSV